MLPIETLVEVVEREADVLGGMENLNPAYARAMLELSVWSAYYGINVREIQRFAGGFQVRFEDWERPDAVCHDGSYGNRSGLWETYRFPWDGKGVTIHDARTLAELLAAYKNGDDWKKIEEGE